MGIKRREITEEEITKYLTEKAEKKAFKVAKKLKSHMVSGYSNDSNPFGDSTLNEKFVWLKKIERDVAQGAGLDMFSVKAEKQRQKERIAEIEKVKKRREEREIERAQREEERQMLARERARAEFHDCEKKAEEFRFDQSKIRENAAIKVEDAEKSSMHPEEKKAEEFHFDQSKIKEDAAKSSMEDKLELKVMKEMGDLVEGERVFGSGAEVNLESQVYWWHDKYRLRKPKYVNRMHTGYEWNKYNRTHYDHDKPPPKFVQGFKFNIFYPELIDKTKAPCYTIEKDDSNGETCLIRFHAGPPYQDLAFRIVNNEWEYSSKKGFKCTFDCGILRVYFNFKKYRYRK